MVPTRILLATFFIVSSFTFSDTFTHDHYKKHHLHFSTQNISEFRIYYTLGNVIDSTSTNRKVFAVSGNGQFMHNLGVDTLMNKMFANIDTAKIADKRERSGIIGYSWHPEEISIRWNYENDFNYYRLDLIVREPGNVNSEYKNYALISIGPDLNYQLVFFIDKKDVPTVVSIMNSFIHRDWGNNYEDNP